MKAPFLIGRAMFGGFFLYSGINHFRQAEALAQYAKSKKVPAAKVGIIATGAMLTVGGASLLLGVKPKLGAAAIIAFLGGVSPIMHDFWNAEDPHQAQNDMINFSKNLALLGATLALASVDPAWEASRSRKNPESIGKAHRLVRDHVA